MKTFKLLIAAGLLACSFGASAATVTYNLTYSNALVDGPTYAQVMIADGDDAASVGDVDFSITTNDVVFDLTGATNFGMQTFSFNYDITNLVGDPTISNINPDTWEVTKNNGSVSEFGKFDLDLAGEGNSRVTTLSFSITGVDGDGIDNYAISSSEEFPYLFATHIAGFAEMEGQTSAFFSGGPIDRQLCNPNIQDCGPTVVPIPAAAWLFGAGLIGLVGVARREPIV